MKKKLLAILLAGALILVGFASCKKKNDETSDDSGFTEDDTVLDYVLVESRDAAGIEQKDEKGNQIYERFTFESLDDESVKITNYVPQIIGSQKVVNGKTVTSYIRCYTVHTVVIPETIDNKRVAGIDDIVFTGLTDLSAVVIPETVTSIGAYAFAKCAELASLTLPASLTDLGDGAFYGCPKLASLTFAPNSALKAIPKSAFMNCSALTALNLPASVKTIGTGAFQNCSAVTTLTVAEGTEAIEAQAFYGLTKLTSVTLPASVSAMGELNFYGCTFTADGVTAPNGSLAAEYLGRVVAGDVPTEPVPAK